MSAEALVIKTRAGRPAELTPADLDALAARAAAAPRLVLHFHGGLVSEAKGRGIAADLDPVYRAADALPIFVVWCSGLQETVANHLSQIAAEEIFQRMLRWTVRYTVGWARGAGPGERSFPGLSLPPAHDVDLELSARRAGREPYAGLTADGDRPDLSAGDEADFRHEMGSDEELARQWAAVRGPGDPAARGGSGAGGPATTTHMDPEVLAELTGGGDGAGSRGALGTSLLVIRCGSALRRVIRRLRAGTDHGLYPTVVEELLRAFYLSYAGGAVWAAMKRDALDTFGPGGAGTAFLDRLAGEIARTGAAPEITLVGHSTGAVFINNLLTAPDRCRLGPPVRTVAFLAPACTTRDYAAALSESADHLSRFRMFTMDDAHERADRLAGALYPRSLLYLVSGVLERDAEDAYRCTPLVGLARYLEPRAADGDDERSVRRFLVEPAARRVVLSPGGDAPGLRAAATRHGDFDDDPAVRDSLRHLIGPGR